MAIEPGFESFYAASHDRLVGQLFALLGDLHEAEDVVQEAFARASFRWSSICRYDAPEAWVRRVALNLATSNLRRARRQLRPLARMGPPPDAPAVTADRVDVHRAMGRLGIRHREVLVLHYVAGLPVDEVGRELRLPTGTVKSRLARARTALARELGIAHQEAGIAR
jgi:RNA polymerase sigma-70 factor, ECF subfamily